MELLEISDLENIEESEIVNPIIKDLIRGLLIAINDWPNPIVHLADYELQVCEFIGGEVTKNNLQDRLSKINLLENAWQAESLTQLLAVFELYESEISLKEVITNLEEKLKDSIG
jgi:hypothetical protein